MAEKTIHSCINGGRIVQTSFSWSYKLSAIIVGTWCVKLPRSYLLAWNKYKEYFRALHIANVFGASIDSDSLSDSDATTNCSW